MEDEEKEQHAQEEKRKENQDQWTLEDGLKFLKKLREMPYDTSKVGQAFVTFHGRKLSDKEKSEKKQEKTEEK